MREVVICEPLRTPIGRFGGSLKDVTSVDLGEAVLREILSRTKINPSSIDDVISGSVIRTARHPRWVALWR